MKKYVLSTQEVSIYPIFESDLAIVNPDSIEAMDDMIVKRIKKVLRKKYIVNNIELIQGIKNTTDHADYTVGDEAEIIVKAEVFTEIDTWNEPEVRWMKNGDPGWPGDSGYDIKDGIIEEINSTELLRELQDVLPISDVTVVVEEPEVDETDFYDFIPKKSWRIHARM